jgi:hypothetical protein
MLPITTSLLRLSLVPLEIARAYGEAFASAASLASPRLPAPRVDSSKGAAAPGKVMSYGNCAPSDQSSNSGKAMSTQFYGTQVATVHYEILFTKRDKEALLEEKTTTVATAMTGNGFASWKIAEFVLDEKGFPRPAGWEQQDVNTFADKVPGTNNYKLKKDYVEFLQVEYQVLSTFDRKPAKYDKDEVDVLEKISSTLETLAPLGAQLPTADPKIKGRFWNDGGTVKVSAG